MNIVSVLDNTVATCIKRPVNFLWNNPVSSIIKRPISSLIDDPVSAIVNNPVTNLFTKRTKIPDDLSSVTTIKPKEVDPADVNMTRSDVDTIWGCVEDLYRTGISPGIVFTLRRHGKVVLNRGIGHSHGNGPGDSNDAEKILITPDTPICQFSASKAVTAMLIHLLLERKEINLLDPVCQYIPEFGKHGKEGTSLYHIISHHGGIPSPPPHTNPEILFQPEEMLNLLCDLKPKSKGGRRQAYHAITGGAILGEIISRVTGKSIRDFLNETIREPLNFRYFNYGVDDEDLDKVAKNYATGLPLFFPISTLSEKALSAPFEEVVRVSNDPRFLQTIIPAGNLVATSDEMSQFFQLLLNGGELNGKRIFDPLTIRRALMESDIIKFDDTMVIPMRYSAGMMLGASPFGLWGPFSNNAYGHIGFINIFCWADPDRDISVSLQTTGKSLIGGHLLTISRLLTYIGWYCKASGIPDEIKDVYSSYIAPVRNILQKSLLEW
ncbi:MAG: beta-lactamase family protein [Candidatus Magnetomorum sp.]|nr:beta-lactamase family protein [Candidatus Magnetomorum sp.]